jgi:hypothetical protein
MSDDLSDRTQPATPRRASSSIEKARSPAAPTHRRGRHDRLPAGPRRHSGPSRFVHRDALKSSLRSQSRTTQPRPSARPRSALISLAPILLGVFLLAIIATLIQIGRPILFHRRRPGRAWTPPAPTPLAHRQRRQASCPRLRHLALISHRLGFILSPVLRYPQVLRLRLSDPLRRCASDRVALLAFGLIDYAIQRIAWKDR